MFLAENEFDGNEGGVEDGECGGLGEVAQDALIGHDDGGHGDHRFLPPEAATFFGGG